MHGTGSGTARRACGRVVRPVALAVCCALVALALAGCSLLPGSGIPLDGTKWRLTGWSLDFADPHDFDLTASFEDERISGTAAINSYSGPYWARSGGGFKVGALTVTEMAGEPLGRRIQDRYLELLRTSTSYKLTNGALRLYDAEGNDLLIFSMVQP